MTKKGIAKAIAEEAGLSVGQTLEIVQKTLDAIVAMLISEGRIELWGFGVFEVKKRASRNARNPRTGEKVFVSEKLVVTFNASDEMESRMQSAVETLAGTNDVT